jgi:group II intron reverse transcriptase/maturase
VVRRRLEPLLEPLFHADSYGYRPRRSAIDAVRTARQRCWRYDWVLDIDIKGFFDSIDWTLLLRAVRKHTDCPWVLLYIERWLKAPAMLDDGTLVPRDRGTPQGGVISPLLANLFLHYAFDNWMARQFPGVTFERYVDDAVVHCASQAQAHQVLAALRERMRGVGLELHPDKTRIVYCKDSNRRGSHEHTAFTFLGFTFRGREVRPRSGKRFTGFNPAISSDALKKISRQVRSWRLHRHTEISEADLAAWVNPRVRGWMQYYGAFYRSALYPLLTRINAYLMRWLRKKHKRLRGRKKAQEAWTRAVTTRPRFFAHWAWVNTVPAVW